MSKTLTMTLISLGLLAAWAVPVQAQLSSDTVKAQNKLLAQRAARADAIRKLAERIRGLHITSDTTVKDFVTQNDTIQTAMTAWLSGMSEVGKAKYNEDGTCEVTLSVTIQEVKVSLQQLSERYQKGDRFKAKDFEQMTVTNTEKELRETGMGAPRPELTVNEGMPITTESSSSTSYLYGAAKEYWMANVDGQQRLMALRAARADGMRKLAERVKGVFITSSTTVQDFITQSDDINVSMETFLRGAREGKILYHDDEPIVELTMEVTLQSIYASLKSWGEAHYKGDQVKLKAVEELSVKTVDTIIKETGMGVAKTKGGVKVTERVSIDMPGWASQTIRETGNAAIDKNNDNAAQAKLMAFRGAELDARRKLAEKLDGLMITSNTSVKDFITQNDEIRTGMLTFQQGAHVVDGSQKVMDDGTVEATVEIELRPLWNMVISYQKKFSLTIK